MKYECISCEHLGSPLCKSCQERSGYKPVKEYGEMINRHKYLQEYLFSLKCDCGAVPKMEVEEE